MLLLVVGRTVKGIMLYGIILTAVTAVAAVAGCLFLSNGQLAYLVDPDKLLWFVWSQRSGLKVQIFFVTTILWWMLALDGTLGRPLLWPLRALSPRSRVLAVQGPLTWRPN